MDMIQDFAKHIAGARDGGWMKYWAKFHESFFLQWWNYIGAELPSLDVIEQMVRESSSAVLLFDAVLVTPPLPPSKRVRCDAASAPPPLPPSSPPTTRVRYDAAPAPPPPPFPPPTTTVSHSSSSVQVPAYFDPSHLAAVQSPSCEIQEAHAKPVPLNPSSIPATPETSQELAQVFSQFQSARAFPDGREAWPSSMQTWRRDTPLRNVCLPSHENSKPLQLRKKEGKWHKNNGPPKYEEEYFGDCTILAQCLWRCLPRERVEVPTKRSSNENEFAREYGAKLCAIFKEEAQTACGRLSIPLCLTPLRTWLKKQSGKHYGMPGEP